MDRKINCITFQTDCESRFDQDVACLLKGEYSICMFCKMPLSVKHTLLDGLAFNAWMEKTRLNPIS